MKHEQREFLAASLIDLQSSPTVQDDVNRQGQWLALREVKTQLPPAPKFDAEILLPSPIKEFVMDEADRMPCAPDYIAAAMIVCLGAVIGARCSVKPKRMGDWMITPNLYGAVVGDPSQKKTPAIAIATRFLDRLEAEETKRADAEGRTFEAAWEAFEARAAALKSTMKKAASGDVVDSERTATAVSEMSKLKEPARPMRRRFKSNDATTEKLGDLLVGNPAGLLVLRDELVGLLASFDRDGRESDRMFYLEAFGGTGTFNIDRIGRGSLFIPNLCLSLFGGIQPEPLSRYLNENAQSLANDGFIQRLQVMVYPEPVTWRWNDRYPLKDARNAVTERIQALAKFDPVALGATPANDFLKLPHFEFDEQGQDIFIEWLSQLHLSTITGETNPVIQQHLAKSDKLFCSVALILHLVQGSTGRIGADCALRAAAWCQYLEGHARRVYALVETAKVATAARLGRHIAAGRLDEGFTSRDVTRKGWSGMNSSAQVETALSILEEHGWVRAYETSEQPGRPTTRYCVNPQVRKGVE